MLRCIGKNQQKQHFFFCYFRDKPSHFFFVLAKSLSLCLSISLSLTHTHTQRTLEKGINPIYLLTGSDRENQSK